MPLAVLRSTENLRPGTKDKQARHGGIDTARDIIGRRCPQFLPLDLNGWGLAPPSAATSTPKIIIITKPVDTPIKTSTSAYYPRETWRYNFLHGLDDDQIDGLLKPCFANQQRHIRNTLNDAPAGILRIGGAGGSSRKTLLISLMMLALGSNKRVLAYSHTLRALDNLAARFDNRNTYGDILAVRYRGEKREVTEVFLSLDRVESPKSFDAGELKWQAGTDSSISVANAVLMVIAEEEPNNYKLFRLWKRH
jgi:hypothetical protein